MSYCRWSSDFGECDVYVYESDSGWQTHVAIRHRKQRVPDEIKAMYPTEHNEQWVARYLAYQEAEKAWLATLPHVMENGFAVLADSEWLSLAEIGAEAGQSYPDPTPGDAPTDLRRLVPRI